MLSLEQRATCFMHAEAQWGRDLQETQHVGSFSTDLFQVLQPLLFNTYVARNDGVWNRASTVLLKHYASIDDVWQWEEKHQDSTYHCGAGHCSLLFFLARFWCMAPVFR